MTREGGSTKGAKNSLRSSLPPSRFVVLIAPGKVLHTWPGDVDAGVPDAQLDNLHKASPARDE
jgi:hypothetical protein